MSASLSGPGHGRQPPSDVVRHPLGFGRPKEADRAAERGGAHGSQTSSRVWLGPDSVPTGSLGSDHGRQPLPASVRRPIGFGRLEEAAITPRKEECTGAEPALAFVSGPAACPLAHRARAMGSSPHQRPCNFRWGSADRAIAQEGVFVLRDPNQLPHLARARRCARRIVRPGSWVATPIGIHAAYGGVRPIGGSWSCYQSGRRTGRRRRRRKEEEREKNTVAEEFI